MEKYYRVVCNGVESSFREGTTYKEISEHYRNFYRYSILTAKVNDDFVDLSDTLKKDSEIRFFTVADEYGNKVYHRSARFMVILAVRKLFGTKAVAVMQHSQDGGVYFTIEHAKINDQTLDDLINEMNNIVKNDYAFMHLTVSRLEASDYFSKRKMADKEHLLKYISNTYINLYRVDDMYDYFYGKMAYSTGQIDRFKIKKVGKGFVLLTPNHYDPDLIKEQKHNDKIYDKFAESNNFATALSLTTVSDLNDKVATGQINDIILASEAYYNDQLLNIADDIISKKTKIVLLAGPSSSGKTTTSRKISIYLKSKGYNTKAISIDDYFESLENRQKDLNGDYDFESIKAVDTELFNEQINKLLNLEEVCLSRYNFLTGKREFDDKVTKLDKNDIIVVEGLHALNDELTKSINNKYKYKIYISPLTSLKIDNHNHVHNSDTRKLRRIIRDSKTRAVDAKTTLKMWTNIQKGEMNNIFPYQNDVDAVINSSLMYELGVLKTYVEPLLYSVDSEEEEYPEALRLINFLKNFLPIPSDEIPKDSVLREFIGGSCFKI